MKKVDYNQSQHQNYQKGREHPEETYLLWTDAIAKYLNRSSGLTILDLGSGTGRFAPRLARYFNAQVIGVEPSDKMRSIAEENNTDERVSYRKGNAGPIPVDDEKCDFAFLSMVIHHFDDLEFCSQELHRLLKPKGHVFIRNSFRDRLDGFLYQKFFPSAKAIDNQMCPSLESVEEVFVTNGFEKIALETIEQTVAESLGAYYERIKMKSFSTFDHMSDEEFESGLLAMKQAAEREEKPTPVTETIDLLVFKKKAEGD